MSAAHTSGEFHKRCECSAGCGRCGIPGSDAPRADADRTDGPERGAAAFLRLLPALLATLLLAAHFMRYWALGMVSLCLLLPFLLLVRRPWAARVYQLVLSLGALLWVGLAVGMARDRRAQGLPSTRLLVILLGVALFTVAAAGLFELPSLRRRYGLRTGDVFRSAPAAQSRDEERSARAPDDRGEK